MKKINCFIIIFLLILYIPIVFAYESSYSKIEVPKEYLKQKNKDIWILEEDDSITTISVEIIDNTSNLNINKLDEESLKEESLIEKLNKSLNNSDGKLDIKTFNVSLAKVNDYKAIKMNIDSILTNQEFNSKVFQTQYIFSSRNYLYYLVISSSNKELLNSKEMNQIINSFTIKDELEINNKEEIKKYYIALSAIVLSGVIIMVVVKKK